MALLKDRIEPATRHECVFVKRVLVWICGQLRVPPSVLVEVVCGSFVLVWNAEEEKENKKAASKKQNNKK